MTSSGPCFGVAVHVLGAVSHKKHLAILGQAFLELLVPFGLDVAPFVYQDCIVGSFVALDAMVPTMVVQKGDPVYDAQWEVLSDGCSGCDVSKVVEQSNVETGNQNLFSLSGQTDGPVTYDQRLS